MRHIGLMLLGLLGLLLLPLYVVAGMFVMLRDIGEEVLNTLKTEGKE